MARAKRNSKRRRRNLTLPGVGVAGMSLALTGGASGAPAPVMDQPTRAYAPPHEIMLGEEEISDVSLATFYVFDKETRKSTRGDLQLAAACGRCGGGCGGCRCGGAGIARCGGGCVGAGIARCGGGCGGGCAVVRCGVARCAVVRCGVARCGGCGGVWWGVACSCTWSCCLQWGFCAICW